MDFALKASDMIDNFDWDSLFHGKNIDETCSAWEETLLSIMEYQSHYDDDECASA